MLRWEGNRPRQIQMTGSLQIIVCSTYYVVTMIIQPVIQTLYSDGHHDDLAIIVNQSSSASLSS